jgi:phenylalanyl-tRNA synthetase alpha chain
MADEILLNEAAYAAWQLIGEYGPIELGEVARRTGIDQAQISATATESAERGFFVIEERQRDELIVNEITIQTLKNGLPEQLAATAIANAGGQMPMPAFIEWAKSTGVPVNEVFKWGAARGWIERSKATVGPAVVLTDAGHKSIGQTADDRRAIDVAIENDGSIFIDALAERGIDIECVRSLLGKRPELAKIKQRTQRTLSLSDAGRRALDSGRIRIVKERNTLTPEDLESGAWRDIKLRPYDVTLAARDVHPAKIHPLRKIIEQTRIAFLEMGFTEVVSPMVESAFWNFDALFQPQDHPARDMQDTFYMRDPAEAPLPTAWDRLQSVAGERAEARATLDIVEAVRRTHEDGWETGSEGWGYTWNPNRSKQVVLRTHTTAATIRALAANPDPPGKFFCVGWTYRNETISFKHLPVFHQVDGIIVDEEANLASLMGTLQEFYSKMGFGRVKFKPAFYPYTEPSVDVVVYMESRGKWLEMGGAGIFRPEVTLPLGCTYPVLAWGLGIERLAMLRFGLSDIRDLYGTNLDALQQVPLCR